MGYIYNALSDVNRENVSEKVREEAIQLGGELKFRGKSFSDWYTLAYDAFETWADGDKWGRLFELIGDELEALEFERTLEDID